jgi:2'-5' RNA ligase
LTYSVWLVPAYSDAKFYNQIIASLSKQYAAPKFAAHMTIYSKISSISEAKKAVSAIKSKKIRAKILGIGESDYLWKTLFVKIKKDRELVSIHKYLHDSLENNYDFTPHLSLIYKKINAKTKREIRSGLKIKKSILFDSMVIIRSSKTVKNWKIIYRKKL